LSSCTDDFLEQKSKDSVIPKSVNDYKELLNHEAYIDPETDLSSYLDIMTDDVKLEILSAEYETDYIRNSYKGYYTWQSDPQIVSYGRFDDEAWNWHYHTILMSNLTIKNLPDLDGSKEEKEDLLAEVKFLRAFSYFMLVNIYGEPYVDGSELGVPINLNVGSSTETLSRSTTGEVYEIIKSDLLSSIKNFDAANLPKDIFQPTSLVSHLLLSRVCLYTKDYKNAEIHAGKVLDKNPQLLDLRTLGPADTSGDSFNVFLTNANPEILFSYGGGGVNCAPWGKDKTWFCMSDELKSLYGENDLRLQGFFLDGKYNGKSYYDFTLTKCGFMTFRVAEAYLNRAEALAELDRNGEALVLIKELRNYRIEDDSFTYSDLKEFIKSERRRELCFENHRWFDLRRNGCKEIIHTYYAGDKCEVTETYKLDKNDKAYTLNPPYSELKNNKIIETINRPNR